MKLEWAAVYTILTFEKEIRSMNVLGIDSRLDLHDTCIQLHSNIQDTNS